MQTLELILRLSAEQVAGARTPGKASGEIRWHGTQKGQVKLADRKVRVKRPRLRHKTEGEVKVPTYEALRQDRGLSQRMLGALMRGVSTREYQEFLPAMAATVGVSRSSVRRQAVEASAEQLKKLQERRWDQVEILVLYIDGQTLNLMRAAGKVSSHEEVEKRLEQLARFLEGSYESAARSLRQGMTEMFTLPRLQIPASLHKCLATTNIIESPQSGVQRRTANVARWRDADMVERWAASAWLVTENNFRRILGYQDLWALAAVLGRETKSKNDLSRKEKVA